MPGLNRCYFCICEVCNRCRCPMYRCRSSLLVRCMYCAENYTKPTTVCDFFEMKYRKHVYRVVRKGQTRVERIEGMLKRIIKRLED